MGVCDGVSLPYAHNICFKVEGLPSTWMDFHNESFQRITENLSDGVDNASIGHAVDEHTFSVREICGQSRIDTSRALAKSCTFSILSFPQFESYPKL